MEIRTFAYEVPAAMDKLLFDKFRGLVYQLCGINLAENKEALVAARVGKRMRVLNLQDYEQYYQHVLADRSGLELTELINSISTNVTHFFREPRHFDLLREWIGQWEKERMAGLRIWSAACSSGEEPYSIAMTLLDCMTRSIPVEISASDISTKVLQAARKGIYRQQDVIKIPPPLLKKFLQVGTEGSGGLFLIKQNVRDLVQFFQINLSTPPYPVQGNLDIIYCKNVMIYFNSELRKLLVQNFQQMLRPGGYLVVGLAESLSGIAHGLKPVEPSVYRKL